MLNMENVRAIQTIERHTSDVTTLDFGGQYYLATGSGDKTVRVWKWVPGSGYMETSYSPISIHKYAVTSVRFSPQGTMLASSSVDGTTALANVRTGIRIHTFVQVNGVSVRVCRFSEDSTFLITLGDDNTICIWDLIHRSLVRSIPDDDTSINTFAVAPDSNYLVTATTTGMLDLRSLSETTDNILESAEAHDLTVLSCEFSLNQIVQEIGELMYHSYHLATGGHDATVKLWNILIEKHHKQFLVPQAKIQLLKIFETQSSAITCVRFSNSGTYIIASSLDKTCCVYDVEGGCLSHLQGHSRYVDCCAFSRDGNLIATGSNDKTVVVWDFSKKLSIDSVLVKISGNHCSSDQEVDQSGEQKMVKHAESNEDNSKLYQRLDHQGGAINSCQFFRNSILAVSTGDKYIRIWKKNNDGRFVELPSSPLEEHKYSVSQVDFSPDGSKLVSVSLDGNAIVWDADSDYSNRIVIDVRTYRSLRTCKYSLDNFLLATAGDDEKIRVWNVRDNSILIDLVGHTDTVTQVAFTPDTNYLITTSLDGCFKVWALCPASEHSLFTQEEAHDLGIQSCDVSPKFDFKGKTQYYMLATCGNDSSVKLWQIRIDITSTVSCSLWKEFRGHGGNIMCVRFCPGTGKIFASTAIDKTVRIWNSYTGECLHVLEGHDMMVTCCSFSSDGILLATGSLDKTVLIWELPQNLTFLAVAAEQMRRYRRKLLDWTNEDIAEWLNNLELPEEANSAIATGIIGKQLVKMTSTEFIEILKVDPGRIECLKNYFFWLKKEDSSSVESIIDVNLPDEFLCPITHEVMLDPVICSDGFTYERAAINEWFLSGKYTSPMTNSMLQNTSLKPNLSLKTTICQFLYGLPDDA